MLSAPIGLGVLGRKSGTLNLLDLITATPKHSKQAVRAAHVPGAYHDKVGLLALRITLDLRHPVLVSCDYEAVS